MGEVQARTVLWYLAFVGFAVNYCQRINLNIVIVEMIAAKGNAGGDTIGGSVGSNDIDIGGVDKALSALSQNDITEGSLIESVKFNISGLSNHDDDISGVIERRDSGDNTFSSTNYTQQPMVVMIKQEKYSLEKKFLNWTNIGYAPEGFHWNEYEQGLVLGSFYWAHWVTQIPGGILAKKYGTKLIFGLSNVIGCGLCFLMPIGSYWDYRVLIILRVLQGFITGLSWPAMHVLTAKWIPPNERSKFVTAYLGGSVGIALFYPLFGYMLHWASWEWVFHVCGLLGTIWWLGWLYYVYDTPAEHPRIDDDEVNFISKALGSSIATHNQESKTPWNEILTSRPVWMNVIAQWGGIWGLFTLMTQAPTYFRVVHNWNIRATGVLSGLPHLMRMLFAYVFSIFADYLLRTDKMSRTNLRKLATAVCCIVKGVMVLILAYFGHNATAAIIFLTMATMFHGAVSSGPLASLVDIAPNYAGIVLGISGMISVLPGFISPYIVGFLTLGNQTFESWKDVFLISAAMLIGSGIIYVLFADSTLQSWNNKQLSGDVEKELELLNKKEGDRDEKDIKNVENEKLNGKI